MMNKKFKPLHGEHKKRFKFSLANGLFKWMNLPKPNMTLVWFYFVVLFILASIGFFLDKLR